MEYYYENYIDQMTPKQKMGWRMLYLLVIKKYPFIKEIKIDKPIDLYDTMFVVSLVVDIEKLEEQYNIKQAERRPLSPSSPYLFPFFKEKYFDMLTQNFNDPLQDYLTECYSIVPSNMSVQCSYSGNMASEVDLKISLRNKILHLSRFEPFYND